LPYRLHAGEHETILLAKEENADLVIIDERDGRRAAEQEGLRVVGTLRVLYEAARQGLCDLDDAYARLQQTNFHASPRLYQHFLDLKAKS
jgi:predicted nucleic acid-binding protein